MLVFGKLLFMEENKKLWFKAKRYGWGWYPATIEGWAVTIGYVLVFIVAEIILARKIVAEPSLNDLFVYGVLVVVATTIIILICIKKGEKPRWRWGDK